MTENANDCQLPDLHLLANEFDDQGAPGEPGLAVARLCPVPSRQTVDGVFPALDVSEARALLGSGGAKAASVGAEVSCGGALCDGHVAHVIGASWPFTTGCADCARFA